MQLFGYRSDELSRPSDKKIVAICDECGKDRVVYKKSYRPLYHTCACRTPEFRQKMSEVTKGHVMSEEAKRKLSETTVGRCLSEERRQKMSEDRKGHIVPGETRQKISASLRGMSYDEWESFATNSPYCPKFNDECKESNREKYGNRCFLTGQKQTDNIAKNGKQYNLSVHHVDMNKRQGCNDHIWKLVPLSLKMHGMSHSKLWQDRIEYLLHHVWYPNGVFCGDE